MKNRLVSFLLAFILLISLTACGSPTQSNAVVSGQNGSFQVTFIDVGQGDAVLIECDGKNMLIDAGTASAASNVIDTLRNRDNPITHLDILVASHLHDDHIGGMIQVMDYLGQHVNGDEIGLVLSNSDRSTNATASKFLDRMGNKIVIPSERTTYNLGSAVVEVIYNRAESENDSLVLLVSYKNTNFLFTGDIEKTAHSTVAAILREKEKTLKGKDNLIKMPHHGAYNSDIFLPDNASDNSLGSLVSASCANYFVISVGQNNYGHPNQKTLDVITQALQAQGLSENGHLFRTDLCGNVVFTVSSNGKRIIPSN